MSRASILPLAAVLFVVAACKPSADTPEGVVERFLDAHYVDMDLDAARGFAVGPALQKVEEEKRLIGDHRIDEATRKPYVTYEMIERRDDGSERATFVYRGSIRVEGADAFARRWIVTTRREAGMWKVSNFQELEIES